MSLLSLCVDQILRPSFLPTYDVPARRKSPAHSAEKRRQVLVFLEKSGRVPSRSIMEYTGYTKQSVMHILYSLETAGEVKRCRVFGAEFLWEVV